MSRTGDAEKETLRQAAESANGMIPKLLEQRSALDERIARLQTVLAAYESVLGKKLKVNPVPVLVDSGTGPNGDPPPTKRRAKKGIVTEQIEEALGNSELEVGELRESINRRHGVLYGRSTIYTALARGENLKFVRQGAKWKLNPMVMMPRAS